MNLTKDPNVRLLIKTFDLVMPRSKKYTFNVTEYSLENGFIVMSEIEVLDANGAFVKKVDPEDVYEYLEGYNVTFEMKK